MIHSINTLSSIDKANEIVVVHSGVAYPHLDHVHIACPFKSFIFHILYIADSLSLPVTLRKHHQDVHFVASWISEELYHQSISVCVCVHACVRVCVCVCVCMGMSASGSRFLFL